MISIYDGCSFSLISLKHIIIKGEACWSSWWQMHITLGLPILYYLMDLFGCFVLFIDVRILYSPRLMYEVAINARLFM